MQLAVAILETLLTKALEESKWTLNECQIVDHSLWYNDGKKGS